MRHNFLIIFFIGLSFSTYTKTMAQVKLKKTKVTKEITLKIPASFSPTLQADRINRYVSYRTPIAMYSSQDRLVDFGINENSSPWVNGDLNILMSFYKANISNLFTEVNFLKEGVETIGNRNFVVFEFTSKVSDEDRTFGGVGSAVSKYTLILYTIRNDKVLLFNFSCPKAATAQWRATANEMMASIRIK